MDIFPSTFPNIGFTCDRGDRKSTTSYFAFIGDNLVTWSKKQDIVSRSSAEIKYRAMAHTTYELLWFSELTN